MKKIASTISMFVILFVSCSKSSDTGTSTTAKTKTELLTNGKWYVTAMVSSAPINYFSSGNLITNLYPNIPSCVVDNSFLFQTGNALIVNEEATKCSSTASQTSNIGWLFQNNEQEIIMDGDLYTILELTTTSFIVKNKDAQMASGVSHFKTITFKH